MDAAITANTDIESTSLCATRTPAKLSIPVPSTDSKQSAFSAQKATRLSTTIFGLGNGITDIDSKITGSRLPTSGQVLRCLMFHLNEGATVNRTKWEAAKLVLSKVSVFYEKACIPMITERKACEKIIKLLDKNSKLRAIPCKRRSNPDSLKMLKEMEDYLAQTFPLWPGNAEQLINNPEDLQFLQSMKSDRSATFGSHDKLLAEKIKRRQKRDISAAEYRKRVRRELILATATHTFKTDSSSSDDTDISDAEFDSPVASISLSPSRNRTQRSHHRAARTGTSAFIPHDIIRRPKLVALATRLKMTPVQQAVYTKALIAEAGGDSSKVLTSYSTADKSRRNIGNEMAKNIREQWVAPKLATLHWDSKLMLSLTNQIVSEERLTVVVGNAVDLKLLGVPAYKPGTDRKSGDIIAGLTINLLRSWHCANSIVNMTFDTTASNTGHVTAACVTIQNQLGRALLWSACRHHVGEIILSHVFEDLQIEASKSPDVTLFTRFRKNYELLQSRNTTDLLSRFDYSPFNETTKAFIDSCRASVIQLAQSDLSLRRDDYLEFIELCTVFLDGEIPGHPFTFKRPGALHKARWMAKLIYSSKICLFEKQIQVLPQDTITMKHQVSKVRDFVNFSTLIYSTWWMTCTSVADAPWNDINLFKSLLRYSAVHKTVSSSALRAFKLHLWYLTAEMVPLALFSSKVPTETRRALADSLLAVKPNTALTNPLHRFGTGFGKPKFPTLITLTTTLADLVGSDSWFTFHILQFDSQFLAEDVASWPNSSSYQTSFNNLQALNIINDCAERGVKLSSDFLSSAKSEEHYQNVLQVVEQDRKHHPNLRKDKTATN